MDNDYFSTPVLHPLARRAVSCGAVQNPRPIPWYRYDGGTISRRMAVYCRLPDQQQLQRQTTWMASLARSWEDES